MLLFDGFRWMGTGLDVLITNVSTRVMPLRRRPFRLIRSVVSGLMSTPPRKCFCYKSVYYDTCYILTLTPDEHEKQNWLR